MTSRLRIACVLTAFVSTVAACGGGGGSGTGGKGGGAGAGAGASGKGGSGVGGSTGGATAGGGIGGSTGGSGGALGGNSGAGGGAGGAGTAGGGGAGTGGATGGSGGTTTGAAGSTAGTAGGGSGGTAGTGGASAGTGGTAGAAGMTGGSGGMTGGSGGGTAGSAGTGGGAAETCGNGVMDPGETCDDHNRIVGDGCGNLCQIEADWRCPTPGSPCVPSAVCGDGVLAAQETCDDGNTQGGDGCAADCRSVDPGYDCRVPGRRCVPICGDSVRTGGEQCDDGNATSGDGCSAICRMEPGATCTGQAGGKSTCTKAACGNGVMEQNEACDCGTSDSGFPAGCKGPNGAFFGDGTGCSRTCTREPVCRSATGVTQACGAICGNGNIEPGEACDDGNNNSGDGCSATCTLETGFMCAATMRTDAEPCQGGSGQCLHLPAVVRDFKNESVSGGHPDFFYIGATVANPVSIAGVQGQAATISFAKRYCVADAAGPAKQQSAVNRSWNLAATNLGTNGKPVFNSGRTNGTLSDCQFIDWSNNGNGGHVPGYGSATAAGRPLNGLTYTLGEPLGGSPMYRGLAPMVTSPDTFAQWFVDSTYTGGAHGVKTLELGAAAGGYQFLPNTHEVYGGFFPFDPPGQFPAAGGSNGPGAVRTVGGEALQCNIWPYWFSSAQFGAGNSCRGDQYLFPPSVDGGLYPSGTWVSNVQGWFHDFWFTTEIRTTFTYTGTFKLDIAATDDFYAFINGVLVVDLGGTHQRIPAHVELGGVTGTAAIIEGGRVDPTTGGTPACPSADPYTGLTTNVATNGDGVGHMNCTTPDCDCRTRVVDLGLQLGKSYELAMFAADRHCTEYNLDIGLSALGGNISACLPHCGDGMRAGDEQCDCGDGVSPPTDPGCGGIANNDSAYGGCRTDCKLAAYCGDGMVNGGEQCDLGAKNNTGGYGTGGCTPGCRFPHFCGDGILDAWAGEQCDLGNAGNGTAGSPCSVICRIAAP